MNRAKGIALVILSAVIFGITPTMAKYTYTHGSNPVMMTMFRSLLPIPIILAVLLIKKIPIKIPAKELGKISVIALIGSTVTSVMLNMSYNYIPVGMSTRAHRSHKNPCADYFQRRDPLLFSRWSRQQLCWHFIGIGIRPDLCVLYGIGR